MYTTLLVLHILGALLTGGICIAALTAIHASNTSWFSPTVARSVLYGLSAWQVISGALLSAVSPSLTALSVCDNLFLYFVILAVPMVALWYADPRRSRLEDFCGQSLVGALLLFTGTLALGL